jgi:hypothetical protein
MDAVFGLIDMLLIGPDSTVNAAVSASCPRVAVIVQEPAFSDV